MKKIILTIITILSFGFAQELKLKPIDVNTTIKKENGKNTYVVKYVYTLDDSSTAIRTVKGVSNIDALGLKENKITEIEKYIAKVERKQKRINKIKTNATKELKYLKKRLAQVNKWKVN